MTGVIVERFFDRRIARREARRSGLKFRVGKKWRVDPIKPRRAYDLISQARTTRPAAAD